MATFSCFAGPKVILFHASMNSMTFCPWYHKYHYKYYFHLMQCRIDGKCRKADKSLTVQMLTLEQIMPNVIFISFVICERTRKKPETNGLEKCRLCSVKCDFSIPFDDNISERDLRKAKNRQKMAGGFRKESRNEMYCSILIIETLKKRKMGMIENLKKLFMGTPAILTSLQS